MNLPAGWDSGTDATGRTFYMNHETTQTQWNHPADPTPESRPPPSYEPPSNGLYAGQRVVTATAVPAPQYVERVGAQPEGIRVSKINKRSKTAADHPHARGVVTTQPGPGHTVIVVQEGNQNIPPNAPDGGQWRQERYCGLITWLVALFVVPFIGCCMPCCPCDERTVYIADGVRYSRYGAIIQPSCCGCG
ncbi:unnamed protein product [Ectocarpus sp. 6 AP-2014]